MTSISLLLSTKINTIFFNKSYKEEINRDIKWFSSWTTHYFKQGGIGIVFAAAHILPIVALSCPVLNIITHLAVSHIFQGKSDELYKHALEKKNGVAAYIAFERGANVKAKNSFNQSLLDLFANQAEKCGKWTEEELNICEALFKKGATADYSKKGFQLMLDHQLVNKNLTSIGLDMIKEGMNPSFPWSNLNASDNSEPDLSLSKTFKLKTRLKTLPFYKRYSELKCKNLTAIAHKKNFDLNNDENLFKKIETALNEPNYCPFILSDHPIERQNLVEQFAQKIFHSNVPAQDEKYNVLEVDLKNYLNSFIELHKIDLKESLSIHLSSEKNSRKIKEIKDKLEDLGQLIKSHSNDFIFHIRGLEFLEASNLISYFPEEDSQVINNFTRKEINNLIKIKNVIFSTDKKTYNKYIKNCSDLEFKMTTLPVLIKTPKSSINQKYLIVNEIRNELENTYSINFTDPAINQVMHALDSLPIQLLSEKARNILQSAVILLQNQVLHGSIPLQKATKEYQKLLLEHDHSSSKQEKISKQHSIIEELRKQDENERKIQIKYKELKAKKTYLNSLVEINTNSIELPLTLIQSLDNEISSYEVKKSSANIKFDVDEELIDLAISSNNCLIKKKKKMLLDLEKIIGADVIGQPRAVKKITQLLKIAGLNLSDESKPPLVCLCAGTSGIGKTEMAKSIAQHFFGSKEKITRIDMSEYHTEASTSRLIGAAPGYVGYENRGCLTESLKKNPDQVILLDEVEKAAPAVLKLFLQVFSDGRLTDSHGITVDCSKAAFLLTTNIGTTEILETYANNPNPELSIEEIVGQAFKQSPHFPYEMLGRMEIIPFTPLTNPEDIKKIAKKILINLRERAKQKYNINLSWTESFINIVSQDNLDIRFGVRSLSKKIEDITLRKMTDLLLSDRLQRNQTIRFNYNNQEKNIQTLIY